IFEPRSDAKRRARPGGAEIRARRRQTRSRAQAPRRRQARRRSQAVTGDSSMKTIILGAFALILTATALEAAPQAGARTCATPQEAAQALVDAAEKNDTAALLQILGPQGKDVVESGDPAEDKKARAEFAQRAHEAMQIEPESDNPNRVTIVTGDNRWP